MSFCILSRYLVDQSCQVSLWLFFQSISPPWSPCHEIYGILPITYTAQQSDTFKASILIERQLLGNQAWSPVPEVTPIILQHGQTSL